MIPSPVRLNGADLMADPSGALWWPDRALLAVADLHLEKGSSFAQRGTPLPPYDTLATIERLEAVVARLRPAQVIALGDSFHDPEAASRIDPVAAARLARLVGGVAWTWIVGNHDPDPRGPWGGDCGTDLRVGPLTFRHEAVPGRAAGEVSGHFHPKASVRLRDQRISARCFVADGARLILPAFGAYAGGLDVMDPAIRGLMGRSFDAHLMGRSRVTRFPHRHLAPRSATP